MQHLLTALWQLVDRFHQLVDHFGLHHSIHDRLFFDHVLIELIEVLAFYFFASDLFEAVVSDGNKKIALACTLIFGQGIPPLTESSEKALDNIFSQRFVMQYIVCKQTELFVIPLKKRFNIMR